MTSGASTYSSTKLLWHLVTEQSLLVSNEVLTNELKLQSDLLVNGLTYFKPSTKASRESFTKKRGSAAQGKLPQFILMLSDLLQVEEELSKQILSTYLASEFRGTKQSLKKLIEDERNQPPLFLDIWQFYKTERLYLLQVLKEIISHAQDETHPHTEQFQTVLQNLNKDNKLKKKIVEQMEEVFNEEIPSKDTHGRHFNKQCLKLWVHFNLREQSQLLQLNLLLLHSTDPSHLERQEFTEIFQLFINHSFGHRQVSEHLQDESNAILAQSVGHLEALTLMYLIDLPRLTLDKSLHSLWNCSESLATTDKLISSLGNYPEHGPVMMTWMLAHYVVEGEDSLTLYHQLGERAVSLGSLKYLASVLDNEVISASPTLSGISKGICYALISVLVSAFEPHRMGLTEEIQMLSRELLREEKLASDFWKQGLDVGLGTHYNNLLCSFPVDLRPLCDLSTSLCASSKSSADLVFQSIQNLEVYAEPIDLVPSRQIALVGLEKWQLLQQRYPNEEMRQVVIAPGTQGLTDGRLFRWQINYNGWNLMLSEIDLAIRQLSQGTNVMKQETAKDVVTMTELFSAILEKSCLAMSSLGPALVPKLLDLVEKCIHTQDPPIEILANTLKCLSILALDKPVFVWSKLSGMNLFPHFSRSAEYIDRVTNDLISGQVGNLLAQQECVRGEYPLLIAFMDLLFICSNCDGFEERESNSLNASLIFLVQDVFPSFQQWRFVERFGREKMGQKILLLFKVILSKNSTKTKVSPRHKLLCQALLQPASIGTLIQIIGTGDRTIQAMIEAQSSWESGAGVELANLVNLAMSVFQHILINTGPPEKLARISKILCSPSGNSNPHIILTVIHYIYHIQSLDLPIAALQLIATIADIFPMSLLACLGSDSEAVKDILIYRLESPTEDVTLKKSIIDLFSSCIETQPGFIQLLMGVSDDVKMTNSVGELTGDDKSKNNSAKLLSVEKTSCLQSILALLNEMKGNEEARLAPLQNSLMNFFLNVWQHHRIVAISHLKSDEEFWNTITWPLFHSNLNGTRNLAAQVLRILASEIFTFAGKLDTRLQTVMEKFCDPKAEFLLKWNTKILDEVKNVSTPMEEEQNVTTFMPPKNDCGSSNFYDVSLLGAWKSFLIVLVKDQPVTLSPGQCHMIASKLIEAIRENLKASDRNPNHHLILTSVSELSLVLMQRWQTKCADNMTSWCKNQALLLEDFVSDFDGLSSRCKAAILGIVNTALKTSHFKLNKDETILDLWLDPCAEILLQSLKQSESGREKIEVDRQVTVLSSNLLKNLIQRINDPNVWFSVLHRKLILQATLSNLHHNLKMRKNPEIVFSELSLLLMISKTQRGCNCLLASDLAQLIFLPLSDIKQEQQGNKEWIAVFQMSLQIISNLLLVGKHDSIETCVNYVALLQDQLTAFLLVPRTSLQLNHLELTVSTATFISLFMSYRKQWLLRHSSSLLHFYQQMCGLLHLSACLLLRPSLLSLLINRQFSSQVQERHQNEKEIERVRRMSSTDQEIETSSSDSANVQNLLLDAIMATLAMLRSLSPDLIDLVTGNVIDLHDYEMLLQIGFSSPAFEQEDCLTYGTLISVANICVRSITRGERSPSPALSRSSSTASPTPVTSSKSGTMDRKRLLIVLEQSLFVLLSQAMLTFGLTANNQSRNIQLLKRELGAEFSSCIESMRRFVHRGTRSPQTVISTTSSPGSSASVAPRLTKSDEQFMKLISNIVQKVFK